jgi:Spy/CpxP family protein refolding chaperone
VLNAELREQLGADEPDEGVVMEQADIIGKLETDARKIRLRTMIRVRALLTEEQREKLVRFHGERKSRRGRNHDGPGGPRRHGPPGPPRF